MPYPVSLREKVYQIIGEGALVETTAADSFRGRLA